MELIRSLFRFIETRRQGGFELFELLLLYLARKHICLIRALGLDLLDPHIEMRRPRHEINHRIAKQTGALTC